MNALLAKLGIDTKPLTEGLKKAKDDVSSFGKTVGAMAGGFTLGSLAQSAGSALLEFGKGAMDLAGDLADAAEQLDISTDSLQGLQGAFMDSGVSSDDFRKALTKLNENMQAAFDGNEAAKKSFERVGISMSELRHMSADEVLLRIADAAKKGGDAAQVNAMAIDLLGQSGAKMVPGLKAGSDGIKEMAKDVDKLSEADIAALDALGDAIGRLSLKSKVLAGHGAGGLMGLFNAIKSNPMQALVNPFGMFGTIMKDAKEQAEEAKKLKLNRADNDAAEKAIKDAAELEKVNQKVAEAEARLAKEKEGELSTEKQIALVKERIAELENKRGGSEDSIEQANTEVEILGQQLELEKLSQKLEAEKAKAAEEAAKKEEEAAKEKAKKDLERTEKSLRQREEDFEDRMDEIKQQQEAFDKFAEEQKRQQEEAANAMLDLENQRKQNIMDSLSDADKLKQAQIEINELEEKNKKEKDGTQIIRNQARIEQLKGEIEAAKRQQVAQLAQDLMAGPGAESARKRKERAEKRAMEKAQRIMASREEEKARAARNNREKIVEGIFKDPGKNPGDNLKAAIDPVTEELKRIRASVAQWGANK